MPLENVYSLEKREGFLRLYSNQNIIKERDRAALMGFKQNQTHFEYFTNMTFNPENNKSEAGISIFQKDDNYLNFTVFKKDESFFIKMYAYKKGQLISKNEKLLENYKGKIKLKILFDEDKYKLFYSTRGFRYRLLDELKNDVLLSQGYTGAHLGLYVTSNGEDSNDYADFDYVDYSVINQELEENIK